jgi:hypothetical protein
VIIPDTTPRIYHRSYAVHVSCRGSARPGGGAARAVRRLRFGTGRTAGTDVAVRGHDRPGHRAGLRVQRAADGHAAAQPVAVLRHRDHRPAGHADRLPDPGDRHRRGGTRWFRPGRGRADGGGHARYAPGRRRGAAAVPPGTRHVDPAGQRAAVRRPAHLPGTLDHRRRQRARCLRPRADQLQRLLRDEHQHVRPGRIRTGGLRPDDEHARHSGSGARRAAGPATAGPVAARLAGLPRRPAVPVRLLRAAFRLRRRRGLPGTDAGRSRVVGGLADLPVADGRRLVGDRDQRGAPVRSHGAAGRVGRRLLRQPARVRHRRGDEPRR